MGLCGAPAGCRVREEHGAPPKHDARLWSGLRVFGFAQLRADWHDR